MALLNRVFNGEKPACPRVSTSGGGRLLVIEVNHELLAKHQNSHSVAWQRTNKWGRNFKKNWWIAPITDIQTVLQQLNTTPNGLNQAEIENRLEQYGRIEGR